MITGYHAAVDPGALGRSVAALVGVHLSDTSDQDAVTVAMQRLEEVEDCWFVAGDESFLIKVRVPDVDALFERARAAGAVVLEHPVDREYGERECTVRDLAGHRWQFSETLRDVGPEEYGCRTVTPWQTRSDA